MQLKFILPLAVLLSACTGYRLALKDAASYEEAGMNAEAFKRYKSLFIEEGDVRSHVGMKRSANRILENIYFEAYELYMHGNYPAASENFDKAEAFRKECESYRLEPVVSPTYYDAMKEVSIRLFSMYYTEAEKFLLMGDYDAAQLPILKMKGLNRQDPRVEYLEVLSEILPAYKEGVKAMDIGLYRQAFVAFDRVCRLDAEFNDALQLREQARVMASYSIAYVQLASNSGAEYDRLLGADIKRAILHLGDPFIELLERQDLEIILEEQRLGMEATGNSESFAQAGRLAGADYLITGEIVSLNSRIVSEVIREREGYLGPGRRDAKVKYQEYERIRSTGILYRFQIIDSETGTIHASEILPITWEEAVSYASFDGDSESLWPGQWNSRILPGKSDRVFGVLEKEKLDELLSAPREFEPESAVVSRLLEQVSSVVASRVKDFKPKHVRH